MNINKTVNDSVFPFKTARNHHKYHMQIIGFQTGRGFLVFSCVLTCVHLCPSCFSPITSI